MAAKLTAKGLVSLLHDGMEAGGWDDSKRKQVLQDVREIMMDYLMDTVDDEVRPTPQLQNRLDFADDLADLIDA